MAFNSLSPKMKECAESLFNMLDNHVEDDDIQDSIEKCKQIARENDIAIMITQSSRWDKDDEYRPRESLNAV